MFADTTIFSMLNYSDIDKSILDKDGKEIKIHFKTFLINKGGD